MDEEKKEARGFFIFFDDAKYLKELNRKEKGWLLEALFNYAQDGTMPYKAERYCWLVFERMRKKIDSYYKFKGLERPSETQDISCSHTFPKDGPIDLDRALAFSEAEFAGISKAQ